MTSTHIIILFSGEYTSGRKLAAEWCREQDQDLLCFFPQMVNTSPDLVKLNDFIFLWMLHVYNIYTFILSIISVNQQFCGWTSLNSPWFQMYDHL